VTTVTIEPAPHVETAASPVVMGKVTGPFGVKGWVRVVPFTERPDTLAGLQSWWMGRRGSWEVVQVDEAAVHGSAVIARIAGCTTRDGAAAWKGAEVAIPREQLPAPGPGEYYWVDLQGAEVRNERDERLGTVAEVFSNGAQDVLRVRDADEEGRPVERLIPFVAHIVLEVSLAQRVIRVAWERDW